MKKLRIVFLLSLSLLLFGCNSNTETLKLDKPTDLIFDGVLRWDEVTNAVSYDVHIDENISEVSDNYFIFLSEGEFDVYIVAKAPGYIDSEPSDTLRVVVDYEEEIDFQYTLDGNIISWNEVENAVSYNLYINGIKYDLDNNYYDFSNLESGVLRVSVQAVYPVGVTNLSDIFNIAHDLILDEEILFQYSIYSNTDLIVWKKFLGSLYVMDSEGVFLESDEVINYAEDSLTILSSFVKLQEVTGEDGDPFVFYLINEDKKIPIKIMITEKAKPYIISQSVITTNGNMDVFFQFELFGGEFYSINGAKDDEVLYEINDNVLTIESSFIGDKFEINNSFILSYVINKDDDSVVGYLYFNKLSE